MQIEAFGNNCTLVAVKFVLNGTKTDEEIVEAFRQHKYVDNSGMYTRDWHKAAVTLGLELTDLEYSYKHTVSTFVKEHKKGVFFVTTMQHAFVIIDGHVWDPNCTASGMSRRVRKWVEVKNSPRKSIPDRKIKNIVIRHTFSKAGERRMSALRYIFRNGPTDPLTLIKETDYTKADYNFDKKRGNLSYD